MKLEIKHLAVYLPYGLKYKDIPTGFNDLRNLNINTFNWCLENGKPILFPLSEYYSEENGYGGYIAFRDFKYEVINKRISLKVYEDLLKNKFDVFGLIDVGLAEPVTEDFNPYK